MRKLLLVALFIGSASLSYAKDFKFNLDRDQLATPEGVQMVHEQIVEFARQECPNLSKSGSIAEVQRCRQSLESELLQSIADPVLTAYAENGELPNQVVQR